MKGPSKAQVVAFHKVFGTRASDMLDLAAREIFQDMASRDGWLTVCAHPRGLGKDTAATSPLVSWLLHGADGIFPVEDQVSIETLLASLGAGDPQLPIPGTDATLPPRPHNLAQVVQNMDAHRQWALVAASAKDIHALALKRTLNRSSSMPDSLLDWLRDVEKAHDDADRDLVKRTRQRGERVALATVLWQRECTRAKEHHAEIQRAQLEAWQAEIDEDSLDLFAPEPPRPEAPILTLPSKPEDEPLPVRNDPVLAARPEPDPTPIEELEAQLDATSQGVLALRRRRAWLETATPFDVWLLRWHVRDRLIKWDANSLVDALMDEGVDVKEQGTELQGNLRSVLVKQMARWKPPEEPGQGVEDGGTNPS